MTKLPDKYNKIFYGVFVLQHFPLHSISWTGLIDIINTRVCCTAKQFSAVQLDTAPLQQNCTVV